MFLKSLKIRREDEVIRNIQFRKGINLIIDETSSELKTSSGNSVGKTTVLRLIDFCLGGDGRNIYKDPEFGSINEHVRDFLVGEKIVLSLVLTDDLDGPADEALVIERNFLKRGEKIQTVNGLEYGNDDFKKELKTRIFRTNSEKPTLGELKSKNIRDEKNKLLHILRVLPPMVTDAVYETLHLFWFGIDIDLSKDKLVRERTLEERLQGRMRREGSMPQIEQSLIIVNRRIKELSRQKETFSINENFDIDISELNQTKKMISSLAMKASKLKLRHNLIMESKNELENSLSEVDPEQVKRLYKKAKSLVPGIQKTFKETLEFHNSIISKRIGFITEELPELDIQLDNIERELSKLRQKEKGLSVKLNESNFVEELRMIVAELNEFHERKGRLDEKKRMWKSSRRKLEEINKKLEVIDSGIDEKAGLIQKRISDFNEVFSDMSKRLDGEYTILSAEKSKNLYKFEIGNVDGNPGTGRKKSQMASFDLAYIKFADTHDIPCLHFILQDQIENVHSNQITSLLNQIVNEISCQYVLPVLRDKLPEDVNIEEMEVLSLSENQKLFKI